MKSFVLKTLFALSLCSFLTACNYTISMAHTSGTADDVIDDTTTASPNVSPSLTVPLTPASSIGITK